MFLFIIIKRIPILSKCWDIEKGLKDSGTFHKQLFLYEDGKGKKY